MALFSSDKKNCFHCKNGSFANFLHGHYNCNCFFNLYLHIPRNNIQQYLIYIQYNQTYIYTYMLIIITDYATTNHAMLSNAGYHCRFVPADNNHRAQEPRGTRNHASHSNVKWSAAQLNTICLVSTFYKAFVMHMELNWHISIAIIFVRLHVKKIWDKRLSELHIGRAIFDLTTEFLSNLLANNGKHNG